MSETLGLSRRLQTVKMFSASRPAFSETTVRWLIFTRDADLTAAGALFRVGTGRKKRLLVDPDAFDAWLSNERGQR